MGTDPGMGEKRWGRQTGGGCGGREKERGGEGNKRGLKGKGEEQEVDLEWAGGQ